MPWAPAFGFAWTAEAAVATRGYAVSWQAAVVDEEFLIVDFGLLIENLTVPRLGVQSTINHQAINNGLLGRRLMVGQVPLEHFV